MRCRADGWPEGSQVQFALHLVDHIVGCAVFRLDVDPARLDAHLMGQPVVGLGALDNVGDIVLAAAGLDVDLR